MYMIWLLLLTLSLTSGVWAFQGPCSSSVSLFAPCAANREERRTWRLAAKKKKKNFVDEVLDALDTMVGVSPLSEEDLKDASANLIIRAEQRNKVAPPKDALQKPSVAVFFALLGIIPSLLFLYAVQSGAIRPFNL
jgi:hypothetical protein